MRDLPEDLRLAVRRLRQQPGFTAVAVLTLALGLGANIAVFTLVQALMLRRLPVQRPQELYRLGDTTDCCVNSGIRPDPAAIWLPIGKEPLMRGAAASLIERADQNWLYAIGRIRPGARPDQMRARATTVLQQWLSA